ncbi:MAG: TRAM domain-containing protein, partial [Paramuribaculum sp.]|nr:TRAM domain-containing protein [Paramuribaculum sp.]
MSRKRKDMPLVEGLEITAVAAEGNALGRINGEKVVFVPFGAPGDIADVKIVRRKHNFCEGRIERLVTPSPIRVEPRCSHFTICGGCRWQHLPYDFQLQQKQQQVTDALERIAKVELPPVTPIIGSDHIWNYRNKMEYTFSNKCWLTREQLDSGEEFSDRNALGFHIPGAFDKVLDIKECHLQDSLGDRIRLFVREYGLKHGYAFYDLRTQTGLLRTLMIRIASTGEVMVVVVFGENNQTAIDDILEAIAVKFPEITSLQYVVNTKCNDTISDQEIIVYSGKPYIEEEMEGLRFRIGPKSFYQTNSPQAYK